MHLGDRGERTLAKGAIIKFLCGSVFVLSVLPGICQTQWEGVSLNNSLLLILLMLTLFINAKLRKGTTSSCHSETVILCFALCFSLFFFFIVTGVFYGFEL